MITINYINSLILYKQSNLIVSLDYDTFDKVLSTTKLLGKKILGIKIHSDIIYDFDAKVLRELCNEMKLLIMDDRKFCDIGATVSRQSEPITKYADLVTAHALPGQGIIDGLKQNCLDNSCGILLIAQMSTKNNLINESYTSSVVELAMSNPDVVLGFISQEKLVGNLLHFSPGVHLEASDDHLMQGYNTPRTLVSRGIDVLIVGRGITNILDDSNIDLLLDGYTNINYDNLIEYCSNILTSDLKNNGMIVESSEGFVLSSGVRSNKYYNIKSLIGYPNLMQNVASYLLILIKKLCNKLFDTNVHQDCNLVLFGIPQGGIPFATALSISSNIPMILVREKPKEYGMGNQIEGDLQEGKKVVVIEDLISTGKSSMQAIEAIQNANAEVIGICSIFNYGFDIAKKLFEKDHIKMVSLSNYNALIELALEKKIISQQDIETLKNWRINPAEWGK